MATRYIQTASFLIPQRRRDDGTLHPPAVFSDFESTLADKFGGFSQGTAMGAWKGPQGDMVSEEHRIYEVAFRDDHYDWVVECAKAISKRVNEAIALKTSSGMIVFDQSGIAEGTVHSEPTDMNPSGWPNEFDIAIQAVISPELVAIHKQFGIDGFRDRISVNGSVYYRSTVTSIKSGQNYSLVVHSQGNGGNDASALAAERLIQKFRPQCIFLVGISAGRKGKCKIGDVVTPRVVIDNTLEVAEARRRYKRPIIRDPSYIMVQMLQGFTQDRKKWLDRLRAHASRPKPRAKQKEWFAKHVAMKPDHHEAGIYSSNVLLRDTHILEQHAKETHQQIKIGEMEAAGFTYACETRTTPIPWYIVRGVSDFGNRKKNDTFHQWASHSAAAYLLGLIEGGIVISRQSLKE